MLDRNPDATPLDTTAEIGRLCKLDPIAYDQEREDAAARLGVRVTTLDAAVRSARVDNPSGSCTIDEQSDLLRAVLLWPEPVDGAALCNEIARQLSRFLVLPPGAATVTALWVLHAHAHEAAQHGPILAVQSPEKRCGKTTCLGILLRLLPTPLPAANISDAALYRAIEKFKPTLVIDEADSFLEDNEAMRGILNSGFSRSTAYVIRCDGDDNDPRAFRTWCPKIIASIGQLPDTLQDRSVVVMLRRKLATETVERYTPAHHDWLDKLARQAARWAHDNLASLKRADPAMPRHLHDRLQDSWRPLLAIADTIGGRWSDAARSAAMELSGSATDTELRSAGTLLLTHIREVFGERSSIGSTDLVNALTARDDWPWIEWRHGRPITARGIARLLAAYKIKPAHTRTGSQYSATMFADAWLRYVPSQDPPAAPFTSVTLAEKSSIYSGMGRSIGGASSVANDDGVRDENLEKPRAINGVTHVRLDGGDSLDDTIEGYIE